MEKPPPSRGQPADRPRVPSRFLNAAAVLTTGDGDPPSVGAGFYSLVSGDNLSGMASWPDTSAGVERVMLACP
jgi:hypothetical protein